MKTLSSVEVLGSIRQAIESAVPRVLNLRASRRAKSDGSYVTEGDLLMQMILLDRIRELLPDSTIVSEEMVNSGAPNFGGHYVVIDPIDGTENFTSGLKEWGVSVSIYRANRHFGSLLAIPEIGTYLQSGDHIVRSESRIHGLSSSLTPSEMAGLPLGPEYRIVGCCVYNMWAVVIGAFASFENPRGAHVWDILAGLNLALENGLSVTVEGEEYAGEYLKEDRKYRFKVKA